ncbi:response regulator [Myxococcota bacterium]|jgi:CheY-like chemotaxis protein|nr:response regulator [Myxococcota bacterium]
MPARTILLVDDDPDFLEQTAVRLQSDGFEVVTADSQAQGEAVLAGGTRFDLAILDLMMEHPDSGFVLGHRVRKTRPGTPILLVTGVTGETGLEFDAATVEERRWVPADAVLPKPVRYEQLKSEVDRLLAG